MEWYWWGAIAIGVIVLLKLMFGRSKVRPPRTNEIDAIFQRSRSEQATADQELANGCGRKSLLNAIACRGVFQGRNGDGVECVWQGIAAARDVIAAARRKRKGERG